MEAHSEVEAAICDAFARFEEEYLGRRPKSIRVHVLGDLVVLRLQAALSAAERHLVESQPTEDGRDLLKSVRTRLVEKARALIDALIADITGVRLLSLHYDISTTTGEEIYVLTLAAPLARSTRAGRDRMQRTPTAC